MIKLKTQVFILVLGLLANTVSGQSFDVRANETKKEQLIATSQAAAEPVFLLLNDQKCQLLGQELWPTQTSFLSGKGFQIFFTKRQSIIIYVLVLSEEVLLRHTCSIAPKLPNIFSHCFRR